MIPRIVSLLLVAVAVLGQAPKAAKPIPQEYRIAGVVRDANNGQTLPAVRVALGSTGSRFGPDRSVLTDPEGRFAFEHLAADKYQMFAEALGYPLQGFEQHEAPYLTGVVVGPGISADKLIFKLQRGAVISGAVTDEFNEPVREAQVMLFRRGLENGRFDTHLTAEGQTNDRGEYKFGGLLAGTYFIAVSARPWFIEQSAMDTSAEVEHIASAETVAKMRTLDLAYPVTFCGGVTDADSASPIDLRNGERTTADIALHSVAAAKVIFKGSPEHPQQPPQVSLTQRVFGDFDIQLQQAQMARSDPSRPDTPIEMITRGVAPGRYVAHFVAMETNEEHETEIDISGEMTIDPATINQEGEASLKGTVTVNDGTKLPGRMAIVLQGRNRSRSFARPLSEEGEFSLEGLPAGTYDVLLANNRGLHILRMQSINAKVTSHTLTLAKGTAAQVRLVLGRGEGEIRGVAQHGDKAIGGAMMLLVPADESDSRFLFRRDQSDSDGTFLLRQIVPGKYYVLGIEDGWELEWSKAAVLKPFLAKAQKVEITPGGKYNVKVEVQSATSAPSSDSVAVGSGHE